MPEKPTIKGVECAVTQDGSLMVMRIVGILNVKPWFDEMPVLTSSAMLRKIDCILASYLGAQGVYYGNLAMFQGLPFRCVSAENGGRASGLESSVCDLVIELTFWAIGEPCEYQMQ